MTIPRGFINDYIVVSWNTTALIIFFLRGDACDIVLQGFCALVVQCTRLHLTLQVLCMQCQVQFEINSTSGV